MATARKRAQPTPLVAVRTTLGRIQAEAERLLGRLRRDVEGLMARSRREFAKDIRDLERRVLQAVHAATREDVTRLEKRITKLESKLARPDRPSETGGERAA